MPLARLSIKSALRIARQDVLAVRLRSGWWVVRTRYGGSTVQVGPVPKAQVRALRRERRIFVALAALGVDAALASAFSARANMNGRAWDKVVRSFVELQDLGGNNVRRRRAPGSPARLGADRPIDTTTEATED